MRVASGRLRYASKHSERLFFKIVVLSVLPLVEDIAWKSHVSLIVKLQRSKDGVECSRIHRFHHGIEVRASGSLRRSGKNLDGGVGVKRIAFRVLARGNHRV